MNPQLGAPARAFPASGPQSVAAIRSRTQLRHYIQADLDALKIGRWRWWMRYTRKIAYFQRLLRVVEFHDHSTGPLHRAIGGFSKWRLMRLSAALGYTIPRGVFGPGLALVHRGTIVVTPRARVGANCRIHQNVTIGQWRGIGPRIGDNVFLGPGAQVIGDVSIGDNVMVASNAVVVGDVPSDVMVGGIPARVIGTAPRWD